MSNKEKLLNLLTSKPRTLDELVSELQVSRDTVSHQISYLKKKGHQIERGYFLRDPDKSSVKATFYKHIKAKDLYGRPLPVKLLANDLSVSYDTLKSTLSEIINDPEAPVSIIQLGISTISVRKRE